ncbi:hypothetical protein HIM_06852 [Hirsutella minnesotensis 3608]|uniref:Up-regulated in Daf-2 domain-containing protein n=1 Tax=Hirsutella minnesotensis 3608 TaxID=1043627 RepID=A0A0F8A4K4_9HYPO|nr:hypothetical protein HIM_06852 [Hirsutella minnesotensis 3608]
MEKKLLLVILSLFQLSWGWSVGTVRRTAKFKIQNNSGKTLETVSLVHKYSNVYVDKLTLRKPVAPGATSDKEFTVEYNTGMFTTGTDWWRVAHVSDNATMLTYTDPVNFRAQIDWLERTLGEILPFTFWMVGAALGAASGAATAGTTTGPGTILGGVSGYTVGKVVTYAVANSETTDGFKQHILREDDANGENVIVIGDDYVSFRSPSTTDDTGVTARIMIPKDLEDFGKDGAGGKIGKAMVV